MAKLADLACLLISWLVDSLAIDGSASRVQQQKKKSWAEKMSACASHDVIHKILFLVIVTHHTSASRPSGMTCVFRNDIMAEILFRGEQKRPPLFDYRCVAFDFPLLSKDTSRCVSSQIRRFKTIFSMRFLVYFIECCKPHPASYR